jgi:hypothetical protein
MRVVAPAILIIWRTRWNGHALREQLGERVRIVDPPHAGHFPLLEQPEGVARAVSEFLGADDVRGPKVKEMGGYPRNADVADATQPYVMWPGTKYEHLMLPVGAQK